MAVIYIEYHLVDHPDLTLALLIEDLQLPKKKKKIIFIKYYLNQ